MKHNKLYCTIAISLSILLLQPCIAQTTVSKKNSKKTTVSNLLQSQHFTFVPSSMSPLSGGFRNITSYYDVRISNDTMKCYLPYFGRAYTASIASADGPLDFTSVNIDYSVSPNKKKGWTILIKPKDKIDIQSFLFTVFDNGSAALQVTSTSRDAISYNGYVVKNEQSK